MPKIIVENCKGFGICVDICPNNSIKIENNKATINEDACLGCEVCIGSCPNGAIISDRYRRRYPYHLPRPHPDYTLFFQPHFHQPYYPRPRMRRRGW